MRRLSLEEVHSISGDNPDLFVGLARNHTYATLKEIATFWGWESHHSAQRRADRYIEEGVDIDKENYCWKLREQKTKEYLNEIARLKKPKVFVTVRSGGVGDVLAKILPKEDE